MRGQPSFSPPAWLRASPAAAHPQPPTTAPARPPARRDAALSRDQPAREHLVDDGRSDLVDEVLLHLRVIAQELHRALLFRRMRLALRLPELLAARVLVLGDRLVGDHVENRILRQSTGG